MKFYKNALCFFIALIEPISS